MTPLTRRTMAHIASGNLIAADEAVRDATGAEALMLRGRIALRRHDWLTAHDHFQQALAENDSDPDLLMCLGSAQYELGFFEKAAASFEAIILGNINLPMAWQKYGFCLAMMQRFPEALSCIERAQSMEPENPEFNHTLAVICALFGMDEGALHHSRLAQKYRPDYTVAQVCEAATLLRMGRWAEAWPKWEARWQLPTPIAPWWYRGQPLYQGDLEGLRGKRVLLRSEQGYGDSIHFARYVEPLSRIAGSIVLETQAELARLFSCLPAEILIAPKMEHQVRALDGIEFDEQTSLMSLPLLFGTTPENVPLPARLLADVWRPVPSHGARIGVCWAGGPRHEDPQAHAVDMRRSIQPVVFEPILSAIKNPVVLQREMLPPEYDWQDTARLINSLALVITVDTAVAHLAASLGIETWMLSRADRCWRWMLHTDRTPWYPTMKIYTQPRLMDWDSVIKQVVSDLRVRNASPRSSL
jgi:tetratricopeptide (TPR) repeat protein